VIDKLTKFTGDHHEALSPAQYTQLIGRAGRRGIDERGTAVVLWSPFVRFDDVAQLAASRTFHLRSAFRPTYNMVANLVRTYDRARARQLLNLSFAQHQADRDIVRLERRVQQRADRLRDLESTAMSPYGDLEEYRRAAGEDGPVEDSLSTLRPGDVIQIGKGRHFGPAAVVATAHRAHGLKITVVTPSGHALSLSGADFDSPVLPIGKVVLPGNYSPNRTDYRRQVGQRVRKTKLSGRPTTRRADSQRHHPVEDDPDLGERLRAADDADRVRGEIAALRRKVEHRDASLGREFDAVLDILGERGYVDLPGWRLSSSGRRLSRIFHESDLLIAETTAAGLFDGLDPASLAAIVSCFVYEHRSPDDPPLPWFPSDDVRDRWQAVERLSEELRRDERRRGLSEHRPPDAGFVAIAYAWAAGESFAEIVTEEDLTGGDFVRTTKQLVDLLQQIATVASPDTAATARRAAEAVRRDVVADTSVVAR
jgi:ATP-dependent RNA helicase HelY